MSDWWNDALKLQRQMLDASAKSLAAGRKAVGAGEQLVRIQETGRQVAEANLAAAKAWWALWGVR